MISIFLVLLLIIGINQAFKVVSSTVGAGQAMSAKSRDAFTAQSAFVQEIGRALVHDDSAPFLIIGSRYQPAFRNKQDRESDRDYDENEPDPFTRYAQMLSIDLDNNNSEGDATVPGERLGPVEMSNRNHRVDIISFFARDLYRRQTGNGATDTLPGTQSETIIPRGTTPAYSWASQSFAADQSSNQAYVSYGHLWLPRYDSTGAPKWYLSTDPNQQTYPGAGTAAVGENPNNFYACDWILGRMAILLASSVYPPDVSLETPLLWGQGSTSENWKQLETTGVAQWWKKARPPTPPLDRNGQMLITIDRPPFIAPGTTYSTRNTELRSFLPIARWYHPQSLQPPGDWACCHWDDQNPEYNIVESSRYDCAIGSFASFRTILSEAIKRGDRYIDPGPPNVPSNPRYLFRWWEPLAYRFRCNPKVPKPLSPGGVAQQQPMMLPHCTQFIVEFAGDFVSQEPLYQYVTPTPGGGKVTMQTNLKGYGDVNGIYTETTRNDGRTDGQVDYYVDKSADNSQQQDRPDLWVRKVRWYGFPRDTNGDGKMDAYPTVDPGNPQPRPGFEVRNNDLQDVVPLRDVFMTYLENHGDPDTVTPGNKNGSAFIPARKQQLMDPIMERDLNPYRTASYTLVNPVYRWPNYLPLPPAPTPVRQTDPRAGDYRDSLTGADAWAARYVAAFGPTDDAISRIKMLRITVVLDDPNNRLAEGQTYEYVIGLP